MNQEQQAKNPFSEHGKLSTTNTDGLLRVFHQLVFQLEADLDVHLKNYNRLIKEPKNKIDVQVKATKKEKVRHFQYYAKEEIIFWEDFPRRRKFYSLRLSEMQKLMVQEKWKADETRDLEQVIQAVTDLLPTCSQKYCQIFGIQEEFQKKAKGKMSFDQVTEDLRMFDSNDTRNWQILGYSFTIMVSDVLSVLMDPANKGAPLFIGSEATALIMSQAKMFSRKLPKTAEDEDNQINETIASKMYEVIQSTWESQIFHFLSRSSKSNFDICLKFVVQALTHDHRKYEEHQIADFIQQVYFGRYLAISPTDMEMGAKVLQLLDMMLSLLNQKSISLFKEGLMATLRHLCEFLWFGSDESLIIGYLQYDSEAMKILWSSVAKIFTVTEHLANRKDNLKEQAHLLMAQILKISTDDFLETNIEKFKTTIKLKQMFMLKKDGEGGPQVALKELRLINQLVVGGHTYSQAFKAWKPKAQELLLCYNEEGTKVLTPVKFNYASVGHVRLQRYFINIFEYFPIIFSPKTQLGVEFPHRQLLEQCTYENLEKVVESCIPSLLSHRNSDQGLEFLNLGLELCRLILDPARAFRARFKQLHPLKTNTDELIQKVREMAQIAIKEILQNDLRLNSKFMQFCLHGHRLPQTGPDSPSPLTTIEQPRTSAELSKQLRQHGQFYLQNKARTITFDDSNEQTRLDFVYEDDLINQILATLEKTSQTDKSKEQYLRYRLQVGSEQQYPELSTVRQESLRMLAVILDILPHIDLTKELVLFMPAYNVSLLGDFKLRHGGQDGLFLQECELILPTYLLLFLDARVQIKAQKCVYKMMVNGSFQVKLALLDQLCYLVKEHMLQGDSKTLKTLQFCLMNAVHVFLWTERCRVAVQDLHRVSVGIVRADYSDIKYIYSYLHVFRLADALGLVGLCSKDIEVRHASVVTLTDLAKLKRLVVKKELWTPLLADLVYLNQTKLNKQITIKMGIVNGMRSQTWTEQQVSDVCFFKLMVDSFEYSKFGMQEQQIRDFQVIYLGEVMRLYKADLLKHVEVRVEHVRDVNAGPVLNLLQVLSQRTIDQFELRQDDPGDAAGFNLLFAIVVSNVTKSHERIKQEPLNEDQVMTLGESISSNTILEQSKTLVAMIETNLNQMHKMPFGKFHPPRIWTSNVLLSFLYYLQDDAQSQSKSLDNLQEVFIIQRIDSASDFTHNLVLFYTLLSQDPLLQGYIQQIFKPLVLVFEMLETMTIQEDSQGHKFTILKVNLTHNILRLLKQLLASRPTLSCQSVLSLQTQAQIVKWSRDLALENTDLQWLLPLVKEIWHAVIGFQSVLPDQEGLVNFDLRFLISLEQEGFQNSLNFYRPSNTRRKTDVQDQQRINEIKILIQHVYAFQPVKPKDPGSILYQKPTSMTHKNVYFKCLLSLLETSSLRQLVENGQFKDVAQSVAKSLIGCSVDKLVKAGLVPKLFLVCLFITVNSIDKGFVEKARIVCLSVLPLLFQDLEYRTMVESQIEQASLSQLVNFESKQFYQFVKRVFRAEEQHNLETHFERYFGLGGFLRDLLNEVIKLQASVEAPLVQPRMLLKVLDMITYFFSGVNLRRSPVTSEDSFIFAHLIDFKSFEFLSKLYKISEKLVDHDSENMTVMNMWYKVCEGRESNFEVLAKFLIHNLSSFVLKQQQRQDSEHELEKHKRYSLCIFNYIKARTQQTDIRSSIEIDTVTWSQKMLKFVLKARLNVTSKYVLEKMKLKKVLELLHGEVNQSDLKLKLRGGFHTQVKIGPRESVSMSQLIQSQTFQKAFRTQQAGSTTLRQLVFILNRQMYDRFGELTPEQQAERLPDLLLRYFENTLVLIANEAERLQIIRFTPKEEVTVTVLLLTLVADLALKGQSNRAYFIYDLLYKLSVSVHGVQKYLKTITIEQFCNLQTEQDILQLFNSRQTFDVFPLFTSVYFKVLSNLASLPRLTKVMLKVWQDTLLKHHSVVQKEQTHQVLFGRTQVRHMLLECFQIVHLMARKKTPSMINNFVHTLECLMDLIQPQAKHQAVFTSFTAPASCDIALGTTAVYWLAFACLVDPLFQQVGVVIMRRILEDSEFYKLLLSLQRVPHTFSQHKLKNIKSSFLSLLFSVVSNPKVSDDAFKSLIVTIKAQDSLLTSQQDNLAKEELHRFLLLLPYLMTHFTVQDVAQSVTLFSNKRTVVQLLKKSLPSISISNKSKILQILDVIQREVDQNDQVLVQEQFELLIDAVKDQLLGQEYGMQVLQECCYTFNQMLLNQVNTARADVLKDSLNRLNTEGKQQVQEVVWGNETLGEETSAVLVECRTVYFALKHIILQETEQSSQEIDCLLYFTGKEGPKRGSTPSELGAKRNQSDSDPFKQQPRLSQKKTFTKKDNVVSKYGGSNQFTNPSNHSDQSNRNSGLPFKPSLPVFKDASDDEVTLEAGAGTFAREINEREMAALQISEQLSSISSKKEDRPQTGQFTNDDFDFSVDHPGHKIQKFRSTQPVIQSKPLDPVPPEPKRHDFERQLRMIAKDDDVLYELEQFLQQQGVDLDQLAFYIKVLDFKAEVNNRNIVAGLILDNYLSEEAEFYIGDKFKDATINRLIDDFKRAIQDESSVSPSLFDECCLVIKPQLQQLVALFMAQ